MNHLELASDERLSEILEEARLAVATKTFPITAEVYLKRVESEVAKRAAH